LYISVMSSTTSLAWWSCSWQTTDFQCLLFSIS